jgi:hypothetical protein
MAPIGKLCFSIFGSGVFASIGSVLVGSFLPKSTNHISIAPCKQILILVLLLKNQEFILFFYYSLLTPNIPNPISNKSYPFF